MAAVSQPVAEEATASKTAGFPILRLARLIALEDESRGKRGISFDDGEAAIRLIEEQYVASFHSSVIEAIAQACRLDKAEVQVASEQKKKARQKRKLEKAARGFVFGAVYNFDEMFVVVGRFGCSVRSSIAICTADQEPEAHSKLWMRVLCETIDGKPALDIAIDDYVEFIEIAQRIGRAGLDAIYKPCTEVFAKVKPGLKVSQDPREVRLIAFDVPDDSFEKLFEQLEGNERLSALISSNAMAEYFARAASKTWGFNFEKSQAPFLRALGPAKVITFDDRRSRRSISLERETSDRIDIIALACDPRAKRAKGARQATKEAPPKFASSSILSAILANEDGAVKGR